MSHKDDLSGQNQEIKSKGNTRFSKRKRDALYYPWLGMRKRCDDPEHKSYKNYGARGIKVCDRWQDFQSFKADCLSLGWEPGLTIDRIDNNGSYKPCNVRFVDSRTQSRNRRTNTLIKIDGQTKTLEEWCEIYDRNRNTVISRITRGMNEVEAIIKPTPSPYKPWKPKAA